MRTEYYNLELAVPKSRVRLEPGEWLEMDFSHFLFRHLSSLDAFGNGVAVRFESRLEESQLSLLLEATSSEKLDTIVSV